MSQESHMRYMRAWREKNREKYRAYSRKHRILHPEKVAASRRKYKKNRPELIAMNKRRAQIHHPEKLLAKRSVYRAVRYGRLLKPNACSNCGKKCVPEAHHRDYSKPLEVIWLCRQCHFDFHGRNWATRRGPDDREGGK